MKLNDTQLGWPITLYTNTKANVAALTSPAEGALAYATDIDALGYYTGAAWRWTANSGAGVMTLSAGADYTLTIPATGTAALLGTAQTFTAAQTISYVTTDGTTIGLRSKTDMTVTSNAARYATSLQIDGAITIGTGITNSGYFASAYYAPLRAQAADLGTLAGLYGLLFNFGHASTVGATATTTTAYGIYVMPYYQAGTITTLYDIYISAPATGGTASTQWALYSAHNANSYLAGNLLLGTTTDSMTAGGSLAVSKDFWHKGSTDKIGFFGATLVTKQTALTTQLTTVTFTAPGTPDYAWGAGTNTNAYGWTTNDEFKTAASVIANLQTRVSELETKLKAYGLLA